MHSATTLFSLPIEVRHIIWAQLFADDWIYIDPCIETSQLQKAQPIPAILRTCRQIQQEAAPLYYSNVQVHFDICKRTGPISLINWLESIGEANAVLVRHFKMRWNNYCDVTLDLRGRPYMPIPTRTKSQHDAVQMYTYQKRVTSLLQQSTTSVSGQDERLYIPLLQLSTANPTISTESSSGHSLSIQGVPLSTAVSPAEFWELHGTAEFCRILSKSLSAHLEDSLSPSGAFRGIADIVEFVTLADEHSSALRWLGFW